MKIGIIIGSLGYGGAERVTIRLAEWFIKKKYQVSIYTTMEPPLKEYVKPNRVVRYLCHKERGKISRIRKLRSTIKIDKPDVVIIMDTPMCVFAVPALIGLKIPYLVSERSYPKTNAIRRTTKYLAHFLMNFADGFIFQTEGAKQYYNKWIQKRSFIIKNPLVLSEMPMPYMGERTKRVVAVGRLIKAKNYPLLIEAFDSFVSEYPEYSLEIYGDGPERNKIKDKINGTYNKNKIILMGIKKDVLSKIQDAEIYVLSSDLEGMPNSLMEAMALGIPTISTNCPPGGPAALINNKVNGILIPVGNVIELRNSLKMLASNKDFRNKLSVNALKIREQVSIETIGIEWERAIKLITNCER